MPTQRERREQKQAAQAASAVRTLVHKRKKRKGRKLTKVEVGGIVALHELGQTNYAINKHTRLSNGVIKKYLANAEAYSTPKMRELIDRIKEHEVLDLSILNVKAKQRLHEIAERMNPIEAIALMDRTFQQRRLLEGKSTENIRTLTTIIQEAQSELTRPKKTMIDISDV